MPHASGESPRDLRNVNGQALQRWVGLGLSGALAAPLAVYASIGSFARYSADDYCWAGILRMQGFLQAQVHWYVGYSPRYAFTFVVNAIELAGTGVVPWLPPLAILAWVLTLLWAIRGLRVRLGWLPGWLSALILAELLAFAAFQTAPDLAQSLYWQTGMLTYLLPLVLATFFIGWVARARATTAGSLMVCAGVTFVAGGLSETYLIPQNVALSLGVGRQCGAAARRLPSNRRRASRGRMARGRARVVGNRARSSHGGARWRHAGRSVAGGRGFDRFGRVSGRTPLCGLPSDRCVVPGPSKRRKRAGASGERLTVAWRPWLLVSAAVAVTLPFCYFPSFFAHNGNPPARSLIVPGAILIACLVFTGCALAPAAAPTARAGAGRCQGGRRADTCADSIVQSLPPFFLSELSQPSMPHCGTAEDALIRAGREAGARPSRGAPATCRTWVSGSSRPTATTGSTSVSHATTVSRASQQPTTHELLARASHAVQDKACAEDRSAASISTY